ncbi:MAG: DUF3472 domain-containing protein [Flavobacteriaceae bacterium]|nr:DUF3472 domain-containing protein [Flavobacteriaceae bacterium]
MIISTRKNIKFCVLFIVLLVSACQQEPVFDVSKLNMDLPTGNTWVINDVNASSEIITKDGITNWTNPKDTLRTFFYTEKAITITLGMIAKGNSKIEVRFNGKSKTMQVSNTEFDTIYIGNYNSVDKGYNTFDVIGISKTDSTFANIKSFVFEAPQDSTVIKYLKDDFYFGRRGPSTHLVFETPTNDIEWLYSEIEIDKGQDVEGCYFVANGFGEGYFGIQVNSPTERRVLFSIWSPYKTDDPKRIPEEQRIQLLKKGDGVTTGEFGNEGSGGQSYKVFNWKAETRYRFLTQIKPNKDNTTNYTAYFFDPESEQWHLIASFKRPITDTYATRPYSFLENFIPDTGVLPRRGGFYNQWMRDKKGQWYEITDAKFSADATARKDARLDYSGGTLKDGFYLMNCGFTNDLTPIGTLLERTKLGVAPHIKFDELD